MKVLGPCRLCGANERNTPLYEVVRDKCKKREREVYCHSCMETLNLIDIFFDDPPEEKLPPRPPFPHRF